MKEIVKQILEEERLGKKRVEEARNQAKEMRLQTEEKAEALVQKAHIQGKEETAKIIEKAQTEAQQAREKAIEEAAREGHAMLENKNANYDKALDMVVNQVLGRS